MNDSANNTGITRAGIIPYHVDEYGEVKMLFMIPSDINFGGPDPQIAKGRLEEDECELDTAIREGEEELGLDKKNIASMPVHVGLFHNKKFSVWAVEVKNMEDFNEFHYETGETKWMTCKDFSFLGREIHKIPVYRAYTIIRQEKSLP